MQILVQHFQCWCYSYPTSTCLTAKATSVLTHLIKFRKYLGENIGELKDFKNCSIEIEEKLEISGGLEVKLTPSKSTYLYN